MIIKNIKELFEINKLNWLIEINGVVYRLMVSLDSESGIEIKERVIKIYLDENEKNCDYFSVKEHLPTKMSPLITGMSPTDKQLKLLIEMFQDSGMFYDRLKLNL